MIDKKTIYWVVAGIGAYLLYRWWSKKQNAPLNTTLTSGIDLQADILADNQEENAGTKIEGDRSTVIGEIFCPSTQYYDKNCQCCKDKNSTHVTSRMSKRKYRRRLRKYGNTNPRFW